MKKTFERNKITQFYQWQFHVAHFTDYSFSFVRYMSGLYGLKLIVLDDEEQELDRRAYDT